jgi:GGDEF domain-containing protein
MSELGPWLVVGGAALLVVCAAVTLTTALRRLHRSRRPAADARSARSALLRSAGDDVQDDDRLMPLLLAAATEATGADAAIVTFVRGGERRRSYSAGLVVHDARSAIDALVEPRESTGPLPTRLVVAVDRPSVTGALAVYWRDEPASVADTDELEALVTSAFPPGVVVTGPPPAAARADEQERLSRLVDLNATLEPALLLRKIVDATVAECGADAAAARMGGLPGPEPVTELTQFSEHERPWAESVLASPALVPSITRYVADRREPAAGGDGPIATAIVVPMPDPDGTALGSLVAVWRRDLGAVADAKVAELEALVDDTRAALGNASRFRQLQSLAVRDPTTGLFDRRHFLGALAGAVETARRTSQPLVLMLFAASGIDPVAHGVHVASLEQALLRASEHIASGIGDLGVTGRVALGEFAAILPGTELLSGRRLLDELAQELPARAAHDARLTWSARAVELEPGEGADELWRRARQGLRPDAAPAAPAARAVTPPVVSGPMRLSVGEHGDDWTLRKRDPGSDG